MHFGDEQLSPTFRADEKIEKQPIMYSNSLFDPVLTFHTSLVSPEDRIKTPRFENLLDKALSKSQLILSQQENTDNIMKFDSEINNLNNFSLRLKQKKLKSI